MDQNPTQIESKSSQTQTEAKIKIKSKSKSKSNQNPAKSKSKSNPKIREILGNQQEGTRTAVPRTPGGVACASPGGLGRLSLGTLWLLHPPLPRGPPVAPLERAERSEAGGRSYEVLGFLGFNLDFLGFPIIVSGFPRISTRISIRILP